MKPFVYSGMHTCTSYCIFGDIFPIMSPKLMFNHLNVGFQSLWRRDFCSRWTDSRKKVTLTTPRMTTPEIRALVTGFIGWELAGDAGKWRFESKHLKEHIYSYEHHITWVRFYLFCLLFHLSSHLVRWSFSQSSCTTVATILMDTYPAGNCWQDFPLKEWFDRGLLAYFWFCGCIEFYYSISVQYAALAGKKRLLMP